MKTETKNISLIVSPKKTTEACKILKNATGKPYSQILDAIKKSESIFIAELVPENFYEGINIVTSIIENFESENIKHRIFINGQQKHKEEMFGIKSKIDNISLKDFR